MTNTESRTPEGLDELGSWDDVDSGEAGDQSREADVRDLAVYGFHSDNQTLVGLGPVERRRRSRPTAEVPDSQRMPQSEPPGPFIAGDDNEDAELLRALGARKVTPWAVLVPVGALLAAAVAVLAVRASAPRAPTPGPAIAAANAPQVAATPAPKADAPSEQVTPPQGNDSAEQHGIEPASLPLEGSTHGVVAKAPVAPVLPVTLPEQPSAPIAGAGASAGVANTKVGALSVTSNPPANVVLDGRPIGQAPRVVQVPPGNHTILFIHPLYGRQSLTVNVNAGRTTNAAANF